MSNADNLKGHGFNEITAEEQRSIAKKGGAASVKSRRKKKELRELLQMLLEKDAGRDSKGKKITSAEVMAVTAIKAAMNGDWKAWELVRDTSGQKPVEKVVVAEVDESIIEEIENEVLRYDT